MDIDHRVPLFVRHFLDDGVPRIARVVHDDVERLVLLHCGTDETRSEVGRAYIACALYRLTSRADNLAHHLRGEDRLNVVDNDTGTFARRLQRDRAATAATATRDQGDFSEKLLGHRKYSNSDVDRSRDGRSALEAGALFTFARTGSPRRLRRARGCAGVPGAHPPPVVDLRSRAAAIPVQRIAQGLSHRADDPC